MIHNYMLNTQHKLVFTQCKYCNKELKNNQDIYIVHNKSFCSEYHRDLYMESKWDDLHNPVVNKPKINNFIKKSPSMVSSTSLQEFFEVREKEIEICPCKIM